MSTSLIIAVTVVVALVVGLAGWALTRAGQAAPEQASAVVAPPAEPEADPEDRTTLPPTVGLYEEDDEDAETVRASPSDMAALLGQLEED